MYIRRLGNFIKNRALEQGISDSVVAKTLNMSEYDVQKLYAGRLFLSGRDISALSKLFNIPEKEFIDLDEEEYQRTVIGTQNNFKDPKNLDKILNIIDAYIDAKECLEVEG